MEMRMSQFDHCLVTQKSSGLRIHPHSFNSTVSDDEMEFFTHRSCDNGTMLAVTQLGQDGVVILQESWC
jgi:hypothetical protein